MDPSDTKQIIINKVFRCQRFGGAPVPKIWWCFGAGALVVPRCRCVGGLSFNSGVNVHRRGGYITCSDQWLNDLIDGGVGVVSLPFKGRLSIL